MGSNRKIRLCSWLFHRDVLNPNGSKEKKAIGIDNIEDALLYAEQDLKDRWEFYKVNYLKKRRK